MNFDEWWEQHTDESVYIPPEVVQAIRDIAEAAWNDSKANSIKICDKVNEQMLMEHDVLIALGSFRCSQAIRKSP